MSDLPPMTPDMLAADGFDPGDRESLVAEVARLRASLGSIALYADTRAGQLKVVPAVALTAVARACRIALGPES